MTLKIQKILNLSTAHLHPLEANKIDEVSILYSESSNLICTDNAVIDDCKKMGMVCLGELLKELKNKYQVDYVLFDPDEPEIDEFKKYDW